MSEPLPPDARAADVDRSRTAEQLKAALDEGRLQIGEYDERLKIAYAAKTYAELDALLADIPGATAISRSAIAKPTATTASSSNARTRSKRKDLKKTWSAFGGAFIFFTGLWAVGWAASQEMPNFWPMWILGIWGVIALCQTWATLTRD